MIANKAFRTVSRLASSSLFSGTRRIHHHKQLPLKKTSQEIYGALGVILTFGAVFSGVFALGGVATQIPVLGGPAPDILKNEANADRLVWDTAVVEDGGPANGGEGRSCPTEASVVRRDGTLMYGYRKSSANGRRGLLNELIYHSFAKKVIPGIHPYIGLIESSISATESSYELFIESVGDNSNLLQHCYSLGKNPEQIRVGNLSNLGCSVAFSAIILSADAFMKNFVVVYQPERKAFVYPIDFEMIDGAIDRSHRRHYVDFNSSPQSAAKRFLDSGALLDYKDITAVGEAIRQQSGGEDTSDFRKGHSVFGTVSSGIYQLIIDSVAEDIENGNILEMYKRIAALTTEDINNMVNKFDFIMTEAERMNYQHELSVIVEHTQSYLPQYEKGSSPKV